MRAERRSEIDYVKLGRALLEHAAMQDEARRRSNEPEVTPEGTEAPVTPPKGGAA